jgi:hypothetical protein
MLYNEYTSHLLIAPNDDIYVGGQYGTTFSYESRKGFVARFNANGNLDTNFSNNGVVLLQSYINIVGSIGFDNDQKLVIGGTDTYSDNSYRFTRIFVEESLSLNTLQSSEEAIIYPNPVGNILNLTIKNPRALQSKIEVLDSHGRLIQHLYHGELKEAYQFDLTHFNSGFYILQIHTSEGKHGIKFLKE